MVVTSLQVWQTMLLLHVLVLMARAVPSLTELGPANASVEPVMVFILCKPSPSVSKWLQMPVVGGPPVALRLASHPDLCAVAAPHSDVADMPQAPAPQASTPEHAGRTLAPAPHPVLTHCAGAGCLGLGYVRRLVCFPGGAQCDVRTRSVRKEPSPSLPATLALSCTHSLAVDDCIDCAHAKCAAQCRL